MKIQNCLVSLFCLVFFGAFLSSCGSPSSEKTNTLPILGSREPITKTVDGQEVIDTLYHSIPEFSFLNQDSVLISQNFFADGVYITNFFFTSCPSICPTMQRNLLAVYKKYHNDPRVKFLSHSIDFKYDSPEVLKSYAEKLGVDNNQWQFVTGSKAEIYGIADFYMVYAKEDAAVPGGYDHSGYTLLVDKNRHIRGAYDGTSVEQVELLMKELEILLKEQN